jgi:hypothetical protein
MRFVDVRMENARLKFTRKKGIERSQNDGDNGGSNS